MNSTNSRLTSFIVLARPVMLEILDASMWAINSLVFSFSSNSYSCLCWTSSDFLRSSFGRHALHDMLPSSKHIFKPMIQYLTSIGYVPGKTLFGYPYDWRSIKSSAGETLAADLTSYVQSIALRTKSNVTIVTHSMGGLLMQLHIGAGSITNYVCMQLIFFELFVSSLNCT